MDYEILTENNLRKDIEKLELNYRESKQMTESLQREKQSLSVTSDYLDVNLFYFLARNSKKKK